MPEAAGRRARAAGLAAALFVAAGCGGRSPRTVWRLPAGHEPVSGLAVGPKDLWVATLNGVARVPREGGAATWLGADAGLTGPAANVRTVALAGDDVWLATAGGVRRLSAATGKAVRSWTVKDGLGSDNVRAVAIVDGRAWAATVAGVSRLDAGGRRWRSWGPAQGLPSPHAYRIAADGTSVWASCIGGGLARLAPGADRWQALPRVRGRGNTFVYAVQPAPDGLWLGTAGGVNFWRAKDAAWDEAICDDGFTDYCVYALALTPGRLWFGTAFGLYRRDLATGRQTTWTARSGLPHDEVVALVADGDGVWIATKAGVATLSGR